MSFLQLIPRMPLRYRFILSFTLLILFLMTFVILIVEKRQRDTFFTEARKRGESMARNLAAVSTTHLITYNYIMLRQNAEKVARETDIAYVIMLDKEGKVAAYSGHDEKQGERLMDPVSLTVSNITAPLIQKIFYEEKGLRVLDIAMPVFVKGSAQRWGVIRLGLSLECMYKDIAYTRNILILIGLFTILVGCVGVIVLSRRITRPLEDLVKGTVEVAKGNLGYKIDIKTGDEIEELSANFNHMIKEVLTQRRELEKRFDEISSLKRYTDYILSSMTNGLLTVDRTGRIITVNEGGLSILGIETENVIGNSYDLTFKENPSLVAILKRAIKEGKIYRNIELDFNRKGETIVLSLNITPLLNKEGSSLGNLIVFEDLTDVKALEEKIRHADRLAAIGTIAASLAHELKNPLTAIKTFVQLMPRKFDSESFRERFNKTVPREINRMVAILENLLDLARKPKLKFSPVNVNDILKSSFDLYTTEMDKIGIRAHISLDPHLPFILADTTYLSRIFSNLIVNALQAMPEGGDFYGFTGTEKKNNGLVVCITLRDTGMGMSEETARNLFNPFFTTKEKGTGLGLATVKRIVEEHKGDIEISSIPNKGSTFKISFPAANPDHEQTW